MASIFRKGQNKIIAACLGISGALAGLAGLFETAGPVGQLVPALPVGYGFTAIIVAFLGRLHPIGILAAGFVMALTYIGGETAQFSLGLPAAHILDHDRGYATLVRGHRRIGGREIGCPQPRR